MTEYSLLLIDGIKVFLPLDFDPPHPLTIDTSSLFGFTTLNIEGWKLI
ncbi:MAG: hypothetical protein P4N59_27400 [Negativicutes bacterium]|nr:hypothetical protein [Negativicutes bacterium]